MDEILEAPVETIGAIEIGDANRYPYEDLLLDSYKNRRIPGEGVFDLETFCENVKEIGYSGPWGTELLAEDLRKLPLDVIVDKAYHSGIKYI